MVVTRTAVIALLTVTTNISQADTNPPLYSREELLGAIQLSYADLWETIDRVRKLAESANAGVSADWAYQETLRVRDDRGTTFTIEGNFDHSDLGGAPDKATDVWYTYRLASTPIASVELRLADFSRTVTVSGTAREHVDALVALVVRDAASHATLIGGFSQRAGILASLSFAFFVLAMLSAYMGWPVAVTTGCLVLVPVTMVSLMVAPWEAIFPGTAVYLGDPSWLVRNGPSLTLWSLAISLIGLVATIVLSRRTTRRSGVATDTGKSDQP